MTSASRQRYRITYQELVERYLAEGAGSGNVRMPVSHLNKWLLHQSLILDTPVSNELDSEFDHCLSAFLNTLTKDNLHPKTIANIGTTIRGLHMVYVAWLSDSNLPTNFNNALREAMVRNGCTKNDLMGRYIEDYGTAFVPSLEKWLSGEASSKHRRARSHTETILSRLEVLLKLPENTLKSRAFAKYPSPRPRPLITTSVVGGRQKSARSLERSKSAIEKRARNSDEIAKHYLAKEPALQAMEEIGHRILATLPPPSRPISRAVQYRNGMLLLLTSFQPQQAYLWSKIRIGDELFKDSNLGQWTLGLPTFEMNDASLSSNQVRQRELTPKLQKVIQTYLDEHRPNLYMADSTNIFLLKSKSGNASKHPSQPQMTEQAAYSLIATAMSNYLGIRLGPHIVHKITSADQLCKEPDPEMFCLDWHGIQRSLR